jgi:hypothetical protein
MIDWKLVLTDKSFDDNEEVQAYLREVEDKINEAFDIDKFVVNLAMYGTARMPNGKVMKLQPGASNEKYGRGPGE